MDINGKIVVVTGSSSGIGRAIAIECAKHKAKVIIHYRKNKTGAETTLNEVKKYSTGKIFQADLSDFSKVKAFFEKIKKSYSRLDILINNAGEFQSGDFDDLKLWQSGFQNVFFSVVYVTKEFLKFTGSSNSRKIINISSIYSFLDMGTTNGFQYCAAKAAVNSLTANLAKKLAPSILVNAIAPGYTWTPNWEGASEKDIEIVKNLNRIKRYIAAEEIASMAIELLKNDAVTGEIIRVDGGLHLPEFLL